MAYYAKLKTKDRVPESISQFIDLKIMNENTLYQVDRIIRNSDHAILMLGGIGRWQDSRWFDFIDENGNMVEFADIKI